MTKAAESKTVFLCGECGYEATRWLGKCPACGSWNSLSEYKPPKNASPTSASARSETSSKLLSDVPDDEYERVSTGIGELDRVLGGGIVNSMAVLLGGDPGIGKSTLLMMTASNLADNLKVLYVTGEESLSQLKLRAKRLGANASMLVLAQTDVDLILAETARVKPNVLIIDSIQTIVCDAASGAAGSVGQIREATLRLLQYTKSTNTALFIVGHVTKEGALAGPKMLEHMVDTVLYFEGDRHDAFRLLRAVKNRFGSTNEIGVFEMRDTGIYEVSDTSRMFVTDSALAGCAVTASIEGTRPLLVEVQALLSKSPFSNPRRMATGFDYNRLLLLVAVIEQKTGITLFDRDVYINVVGGLRIGERASDLAVALAILSAYREKPLPEYTAVFGEIGLTGELRPISRADTRINECVRLGYKRIVLPKSYFGLVNLPREVIPIFVTTLSEAAKLQ